MLVLVQLFPARRHRATKNFALAAAKLSSMPIVFSIIVPQIIVQEAKSARIAERYTIWRSTLETEEGYVVFIITQFSINFSSFRVIYAPKNIVPTAMTSMIRSEAVS